MQMSSNHDAGLILLAVVVCIFAAFSALNIASRSTEARGITAVGWTFFASVVLGGGIWSMHFIAMLATDLPGVTMLFDGPMTLGSMAIAIVFTWGGLALVRALGTDILMLLAGGLSMGLGIAGMHYLGMAAMRMPMEIVYDPVLFMVSFAIAITASMAALWLCLNLDTLLWRLCSALVMAVAVAGMHYTGMAAATFELKTGFVVNPSDLVGSDMLAYAIAIGDVLLIGLGLATALVDKRVGDNLKAGGERIQRSEERFRLMVNGLQDHAIVMLDPGGRISSWNNGATRLYGYSAEEALGLSSATLDTDSVNGVRNMAHALSEANMRGRFESEMRRRRKDGSEYWASVTFHPVYDPQGDLSGYASITHDISQRRAAETALRSAFDGLEAKVAERTRELKAAMEAAEAANSAKSSFLANMSHELRTPLNAIIGYTEMLIEDFEDQGDAGTVDDLHRIEKSGRHLLDLINEVLDLAKVEAGRVTLDLEAVDIAALVDEAASTVRPIAERYGTAMSSISMWTLTASTWNRTASACSSAC
ncbi:MAG: MHYT domain-containing protein [Minwuia sp.]|nr:MHYT domain-containing protein [Minwuia sp.]